jgi:hypothetical protein
MRVDAGSLTSAHHGLSRSDQHDALAAQEFGELLIAAAPRRAGSSNEIPNGAGDLNPVPVRSADGALQP